MQIELIDRVDGSTEVLDQSSSPSRYDWHIGVVAEAYRLSEADVLRRLSEGETFATPGYLRRLYRD